MVSYEGKEQEDPENEVLREKEKVTTAPPPPGAPFIPPPPIFDPKKRTNTLRQAPVSSSNTNKEKTSLPLPKSGGNMLISQGDIMNIKRYFACNNFLIRSALKSRASLPPNKIAAINPQQQESAPKFPKVTLHPPKPKS